MKVKEPDLTEQIREIFGTTDAKELRRIAEDAACYRKKGNSANRSPVGRKNSFTDPQLANILALQKQGVKITEIAKKYHVSRQTIYSQIKRVDNPSWNDFEYFLEDRCFPRTRDHAKEILRDMRIPFYDPLLIIEKTDGYMEGDHQWIMMVKKER